MQVTLANGEEHVLVGSLDLSQGKVLPGEIVGSKPQVGSKSTIFRIKTLVP